MDWIMGLFTIFTKFDKMFRNMRYFFRAFLIILKERSFNFLKFNNNFGDNIFLSNGQRCPIGKELFLLFCEKNRFGTIPKKLR